LNVNVYFMKHPLVGEPVDFSGYFRQRGRDHLLGLLGGAVWGTGMVFNFVAASLVGVAISYAIGQAAPMVAALWGVFVWNEFRGANATAKRYLAATFVFYLLALFVIARAYTARGESPAAFDRRCIPAGCVAPPSNIPDILSCRALPAGRLAGLDPTPDFHHGLYTSAT